MGRASARPGGFDARHYAHVIANDGRRIDAGRRATPSDEVFEDDAQNFSGEKNDFFNGSQFSRAAGPL
jgi:hypothetical protein